MRHGHEFSRRLLLLSAAIVAAHFLTVIWHLLLLARVQPGTPTAAFFGLIVINLLPVAGVVASANGFLKTGAAMIILPFGVALVVGLYVHFLSRGADNVLRMPASSFRTPFQISAFLLIVLEALGCVAALFLTLSGINRSEAQARLRG